jgi:hypothetical protein
VTAVAAIQRSLTLTRRCASEVDAQERPGRRDSVVDGQCLDLDDGFKRGQAPRSGVDIPGGEHSDVQLRDRDRRDRALVGKGRLVQPPTGLARDEDSCRAARVRPAASLDRAEVVRRVAREVGEIVAEARIGLRASESPDRFGPRQPSPSRRLEGNERCDRVPAVGDDDLLAGLDAPQQVGGVVM